MKRRLRPLTLAIAAILVFGTYLIYTQYTVQLIKTQSDFESRIYLHVQTGILTPGSEFDALTSIQQVLDSLDLPMITFNAEGAITGAINLPFEMDLGSEAGRQRVQEYARGIERRHPRNRASQPGIGAIIFGAPPWIAWLRWVPYLQVAAGLALALVAVVMVRADLRAERERMWSAMARELAHQMGTPLSSLSGWVEMLTLPPARRTDMTSDAHMAEVMSADLDRLERVSRRFELIGKPPALESVAPQEVVDELRAYFEPRLPKLASGIRFRARIAANVPRIQANRVLLAWALENLVKNSVDALAGRGGRILVSAQGAGDQVLLKVADDGPGIDPRIRDRIFDPGASTKAGGWGVGLSLARRIVHDVHGGRIAVRSRKRGGAVFEISLPAATT